MKQLLFLLTFCTFVFSTQCEIKIEQIQKEIAYAKITIIKKKSLSLESALNRLCEISSFL